jgi:CHASE3 domain sensor protein
MFAKMKTRTKVITGFSFAIAVALAVGFAGYKGINNLSSHVEDVGLVRLPGIQALNAVEAGQLNAGYGIRGLLIARYSDAQTRAKQYDLIAEGLKQAEEGITHFEDLTKSSEEATAWKDFQEAFAAWKKSLAALQGHCQEKDRLLAAGARKDDPKVASTDDATFATAQDTRNLMLVAHNKLQKLVTLNNNLADKRIAEAASDASRSTVMIFASIVMGVVILTALGYFISMNISRMLNVVISEATRLADDAVNGKLQTRGNTALISDEFRQLDARCRGQSLESYGKVHEPYFQGGHPRQDRG